MKKLIFLSVIISLACISEYTYSQSGIKWSFGGNDPTLTDYLGTYTSTPLIFKTDNIERMRILEIGYVGIGTSAPLYKLQVIGTAGISENLYLGSNLTLNGNTSEITSGTGTLSFGNTNLITTGKFNAGGVSCSGPGSFKDMFVQDKISVGSYLTINGNVPEIISGSGSLSFGNSNLNTTGAISAGGLNVQGLTEFMKITVQDKVNIGNLIYFFNPNPAINSNSNLYIQSGSGGGNTIINFLSGNLGIGTDNPTMKVDINGDAFIRGYLYVNNGVIIGKKIETKSVDSDTLKVNKEAKIGTQLILDGNNSQIYSISGLVDFRNSNLTTTGNITASRIETDIFHSDTISFSEINSTGNIITTGDIYARNIFAEQTVSIGNFTFKNGGSDSLPATKDTIKTQYPIVIKSTANSIRMASDTVIMKDRVAIGRENAEYSLDVAGNARFKDLLICEGGLIIGREYQGGKGDIDSLISKESRTDTLNASKVKAAEVNASDKINVGSGNILIDGTHSQITSTTGLIDFGSTGLKTTGNFTVGNITAQHFSIDTSVSNQLFVTNELKIGTQTMILSSLPDPSGISLNSIYTNNGDLKIQCVPGNTWNTIINNENTGKVGIGTSNIDNISEKVTVGGNLMIKGDGGFDNEGEEAYLYLGDKNHYIKSVHGGTSEQGGLRIGTLGAENGITFFQFNGNVGIGTDNPQSKLDVIGDIRVNDYDLYLRPYYDAQGNVLDGNHGLGWYGSSKQFAGVAVNGPVLYGFDGGALGSNQFGNKNIAIVWKSDGNVGIGTACPDAKLCVNGVIKVSEEVTVETFGWCDYVFEDNYKLSPLSEVEKFIKQNHHLPEIPSAVTVEEEGVGLLDMNKKLLKKVEELTLYIIEQEKRIQKLESATNGNQ